jgi:hypothetical protein
MRAMAALACAVMSLSCRDERVAPRVPIDRSTVVVSPTSAIADGQSPLRVKLTRLDEFDVPVAGEAVSLRFEVDGGVVRPTAGVTDDAGTFEWLVTSTQSGRFEATLDIADAGSLVVPLRFRPVVPPDRFPLPTRPALFSGSLTTCAIRPDLSLWCWGNALRAGLPIEVPGLKGRVQQVAPDGNHVCALLTSGEVACWGTFTRFADGGVSVRVVASPMVVPLPERLVQLFAGADFLCGLDAEGTAWCWGNDFYEAFPFDGAPANEGAAVAIAENVSALSVGSFHACVVLDGGVRCLGLNPTGQLGIAPGRSAVGEWVRVEVPGPVRRLRSDLFMTCAEGERLTCWNTNPVADSGVVEFSPGTSGDVFIPTFAGADAGLTTARRGVLTMQDGGVFFEPFGGRREQVPGLPAGLVDLSASVFTACAMTNAGAVWCWGSNLGFALGDGSTVEYRATPAPVAFP